MFAKERFEKDRAKAFAQALIDEHWDCNIPIDPEEYARRLGLRVERSDDLGLKTGVLDANTFSSASMSIPPPNTNALPSPANSDGFVSGTRGRRKERTRPRSFLFIPNEIVRRKPSH